MSLFSIGAGFGLIFSERLRFSGALVRSPFYQKIFAAVIRLCFHILLLTQFLLLAFWFCVRDFYFMIRRNFVSPHFFCVIFTLSTLRNEMSSEVKCFSFELKRNFLKGLPIFPAETCLFRIFEPFRQWNCDRFRENCWRHFAPYWHASVVEQVSFVADFKFPFEHAAPDVVNCFAKIFDQID